MKGYRLPAPKVCLRGSQGEERTSELGLRVPEECDRKPTLKKKRRKDNKDDEVENKRVAWAAGC